MAAHRFNMSAIWQRFNNVRSCLHRKHVQLVWGERGSLGPALANFACPSLTFVSKRDGEMWSQNYTHGAPVGPATILGPTQITGTSIAFKTTGPIDHAVVAALVHSLRSRIPGLLITVQADR
jgi:DNA gyrase/topoisomerase IV subunit B